MASNPDTTKYVDLTLFAASTREEHRQTRSFVYCTRMGRPGLSREVVGRIAELHGCDTSAQAIADEFGISRASVFNVWRREGLNEPKDKSPNGYRRCSECGTTVESQGEQAPFARRGACSRECLRKKQRRHNRSTKFGISEDQYEKMLSAQGGACAICGKKPGRKQLAVDHNHKTGAVRGLLCSHCNCAIGMLNCDDDEFYALVKSAIRYIRKHEAMS